MKKTQLEGTKSAHFRKNNDLTLLSAPKKEFELLYRQRDPDHTDQPYENIIFMKSKKCDNKSKRKAKEPPVQELKQMVAQIEQQFKEKHRQSKDSSSKVIASKSPTSAKNLFKNKQIKETFHSKASSRWTKYRKQEALAPENVKKYKNMLSPTRALKAKESTNKGKEDTLSSKFLRSTQETFRKDKTKATGKRLKDDEALAPFSSEPQEYILLENNFVELTHEDVNTLELKITSNKTVNDAKHLDISKPFPSVKCYSDFQEQKIPQNSCHRISSHINSMHQCEQEMIKDEEEHSFYEQQLQIQVMEMFMISKVKLIQRWWRGVISSQKQKNLDPIVFRKCNQDFEESMMFLHSGMHVSDVSPIKMIDNLHADRSDNAMQRPDPLRLRQDAAEQQLQTHLQLLQHLLEDNRITAQTYFEKKALIQAKYQHQLQQIQELEKLMSENTQRAYQITMKTQQDRIKLFNSHQQIDCHTLDQIFGKDFTSSTSPVLPPNYEMMVVNRQKSTGCHYDGEEKIKPSIYQKHSSDDDYSEDFQEEEENEAQEGALDEYNANFTQLLDEYKSRQEVKMEIDKRAAIQMGALVEEIPEEVRAEYIGIDTSLNSIHRFVLSFFKFYIFYYKDQFLRLINMPYGYNIDRRLAFLHGCELDDGPQEDENGAIYGLETIISDDILDEFYEKVYDLSAPMSPARRANFQFDQIHNRALLDSFNQALNHFRPYFLINGPPYPWNHSQKALTFYFIAEQNIQEVFEKTQFKLLRWASTLCGIIPGKHSSPCPNTQGMSTEQALELYRNNTHPDLFQTREDRLTKNEKAEVGETNHEWNSFEEQATVIHLQNSDFVFSQLVQQFVLQYFLKNSTEHLFSKNFDFFHGLSEEQSGQQHA